MRSFARIGICTLALALGLGAATPAFSTVTTLQDRDHDGDRDRDDSMYRNNRNFQKGWKDGQHHKHKNRKWKNDADRQAYEAGFSHGDRGEQWQKNNHDRDHDRH
jgi:hypothetical protein